jgi:hypothetical protein
MTEFLGRKVAVIEGRRRQPLHYRRSRRVHWVAAGTVLALIFIASWWLWNSWLCGCIASLIGPAEAQPSSIASRSPAQLTGVARVIDGDTIHIGTWCVRLFGIDAPKLHQTCSRDHELVEFGQMSTPEQRCIGGPE